MSTKTTFAYSSEEPRFHLYHDYLDDDHVCLELGGDGIEFEASNGNVMVRIPIEVWEVIRTRGAAETDYADITDEQVDEMASESADRFRAILGKGTGREQRLVESREEVLRIREEHQRRRATIAALEAEQR